MVLIHGWVHFSLGGKMLKNRTDYGKEGVNTKKPGKDKSEFQRKNAHL